MQQENFNDLFAFAAVATDRSFTKAAARLGVSPSALSHTIRNLEARLGLRLLTRTTRSVSPTEAGERLLRTLKPRFDEITSELAMLSDQRETPAGTIRITASEHAAISIIAPALQKLLPQYPDINVEVNIDSGLTNIVAERFDIGVRLGERVAKDMIAVRISPDLRWVIVGSPDYFLRHPRPEVPQDLAGHNCINIRFPTHGELFVWDFEKDGREVKVRVEGQLTFNSIFMRLDAAVAGLGLAYLPEDRAAPFIEDGRLVAVLDDWCQPCAGYHLYYPNRRHASLAFSLVVDALRYQP
ncbi:MULTISPECIES: LysR family transcriptional regulator [Pseudomonas syringae group]|uniref:LysR family transcriptional regulator n=1 Tax=Pseudomonas syringae group TaxID=136849 RepID=UPI001E4A014E|nr:MULTISPECIES: LysR family transcriptional regulator [Pseudomonas]MCD5976579.1 LysR family transcriptional regulator [Pseudomonas quasicaspiana]MDU8359195.1 LysR family transcriptional regulator [Pseudomonas syringae group sp. J309-1]